MSNLIAGIDVGTTKICTLVGEMTSDDAVHIIGMGQTAAHGLRRGVVVNITEATGAIGESLHRAEEAAGHRIERAFVSVSGNHIGNVSSHGVAAVRKAQQGITHEDVERALEAARAIAIPHNRDIIYTAPRTWTVDEQQGVRDPIGMHGFRLEVDAQVITGAATAVANLVNCVTSNDVEVEDLVLGSLAAAEAVLTSAERDMGVTLADIGGGTTDIAIFLDGAPYHVVVLDVGGNHLTQDLAVGLHTPFKVAESLKLRYGNLDPAALPTDESIQISQFGDQGHEQVQRRFLAEILQARAEEMVELVLREIKRSGYDGLLPAGVVLTGGAAQLPGWVDLGRQTLQMPVRIGVPKSQISGLRDELRNPTHATSVGLLLWGSQQRHPGRQRNAPSPFLERVVHWLRNLLPDPH